MVHTNFKACRFISFHVGHGSAINLSNRRDILLEDGKKAMESRDYLSASENYRGAYHAFEQEANPKGSIVALKELGTSFMYSGKYDSLFKYSELLVALAIEEKDYESITQGLGIPCEIYYIRGDFQNTLKYALKSIPYYNKIPFVFLTSYADKATLERAKHTNPMGYIVKPFNEKDLFATLEIALFNYSQRQHPISLNLDVLNERLLSQLTAKEFDILKDIYEGRTNNQMAERNFISVNTVKSHIKKIYDKLDVHSRSQAIVKIREMMK